MVTNEDLRDFGIALAILEDALHEAANAAEEGGEISYLSTAASHVFNARLALGLIIAQREEEKTWTSN